MGVSQRSLQNAPADGAGPHHQSRRRLSRRRNDAYHRRRQQNRLKQPRSPGWRSTAYYRRVFIRLSCTSYLHLPATSTILTPCQHHTSTTFTFCGMLPHTLTSMLDTPQTLQHGSKRITPGMYPTHLNMPHGISKRPLRSSIKKRPLLMNANSNPEQVGRTLQSIFSSPAAALPGCCFEVVKSRCLVRSNGFVFNSMKKREASASLRPPGHYLRPVWANRREARRRLVTP